MLPGILGPVTGKRALVLAGGGLAGIAWETGILRGVAEESPSTAEELLNLDVLVGTSAGSTVAAQLGSGLPIEELFDRQVATSSAEIDPGVGIDDIAALFLAAVQQPGTVEQKLQHIGRAALDTPTVEEAVRRAVIAARLPVHDWPRRTLQITAIDISTGKLVSFDSDSGVSLVDAVAASCAVPGAWPPVTVDGRRYMDGGVASSVNMALADDCAAAVVLVPSSRSAPAPFGVSAAEEIDGFSGPALAVFADDDALAAFGPNPLDPACRVPAAQAGRLQGRRIAGALAEFLAAPA